MGNASGIFLTICKDKCFVVIYDNSVTVTCITSNTISIQTKLYIIITYPCSIESDRLCQIITAILCYPIQTRNRNPNSFWLLSCPTECVCEVSAIAVTGIIPISIMPLSRNVNIFFFIEFLPCISKPCL